MRIIPRKIKVRNNVWKCYSMKDILLALMMFAVIFVCITASVWWLAIVLGLVSLVMFMPTGDGIFYSYIAENIRFLFSRKRFDENSKKEKEKIDDKLHIKEIKENGLLVYKNGYYGRVIQIGQKNFKIETEIQQDIDIEYFANALKLLEENQSADIVKIDRPMKLDKYSEDLFARLNEEKQSAGTSKQKDARIGILQERLDRVDDINNIYKQYVSQFYFVVYGRGEQDLENTASNISSEINKCGLATQILDNRQVAVFLKYCNFRNFDERTVYDIPEEELLDWTKPKSLEFKSNRYTIDGIEAAVMAISEYPLRVKNAWGAGIFNIPNTKVVLHMQPVDKTKAIRRIDKCIGDMEVKQITSEQASEANTAQIHRNTMIALLDSLQAENESLLDVTLTVTAYNYLDNPNYKRVARRALQTGNFKTTLLSGLQTNGFDSACVSPETKLTNYENGINSSSLAAVFPFVRNSVMDENGFMLGENMENRSPLFLNIWKRGSLYQNSNAMVIGQSGSGKSFFLKSLILNEWSNNTRIILADPEAEYLALVRNLKGENIDVGSAQSGKINPFHIYNILTEDGTVADPKTTFNTHLKVLESFFKIVLEGAPSDIIELVNNLAIETYKRKGITDKTDCTNLPAEKFPLFKDLLDTLYLYRDNGQMKHVSNREFMTAELYLQKFVTGRYSDIWNSPSTLEVDNSIINFCFQSLFANKNNVVANAQMLLVFRFIEQEIINTREANRNGKNIRTLVIVDEAHCFIDAKFPIALDFFYTMSKRIRKYNGSFIPATQNIADWNANEELRSKTSAIIKNSQYMFIFKLSAPDMKDVLDIYKAGDGFNLDEQRMILSAITGQAFFVGSSELRTRIRVTTGDYMQGLFDDRKRGGEGNESKKAS